MGPAYQSEESEGRRGGGERKVAALRRELEELRSRMDNLPTELVVRGEGAQMEWRSAVEKVEAARNSRLISNTFYREDIW